MVRRELVIVVEKGDPGAAGVIQRVIHWPVTNDLPSSFTVRRIRGRRKVHKPHTRIVDLADRGEGFRRGAITDNEDVQVRIGLPNCRCERSFDEEFGTVLCRDAHRHQRLASVLLRPAHVLPSSESTELPSGSGNLASISEGSSGVIHELPGSDGERSKRAHACRFVARWPKLEPNRARRRLRSRFSCPNDEG